MKTKYFLLSLVLLKVLVFSPYIQAQDDNIDIPDEESFIPPSPSDSPPVIIDESDSTDVSDVEEYDN